MTNQYKKTRSYAQRKALKQKYKKLNEAEVKRLNPFLESLLPKFHPPTTGN